MTKILKTRSELEKLLLNEARQSGRCLGLADIFITGPPLIGPDKEFLQNPPEFFRFFSARQIPQWAWRR